MGSKSKKLQNLNKVWTEDEQYVIAKQYLEEKVTFKFDAPIYLSDPKFTEALQESLFLFHSGTVNLGHMLSGVWNDHQGPQYVLSHFTFSQSHLFLDRCNEILPGANHFANNAMLVRERQRMVWMQYEDQCFSCFGNYDWPKFDGSYSANLIRFRVESFYFWSKESVEEHGTDFHSLHSTKHDKVNGNELNCVLLSILPKCGP